MATNDEITQAYDEEIYFCGLERSIFLNALEYKVRFAQGQPAQAVAAVSAANCLQYQILLDGRAGLPQQALASGQAALGISGHLLRVSQVQAAINLERGYVLSGAPAADALAAALSQALPQKREIAMPVNGQVV